MVQIHGGFYIFPFMIVHGPHMVKARDMREHSATLVKVSYKGWKGTYF